MLRKLTRATIETTTRLVTTARRGRRLAPPGGQVEVKLNLGCALGVAPGWINVDGSLNALVASWPKAAHRLLYRLSGVNRYYSRDEYCALLAGHTFVHHDLTHGIPFTDGAADFVYSSHFLEHLPREAAARLLAECHRVLKPGGTARICVPDLEYAVSLYGKGEKERMLQNYFFVEDLGSSYAKHRYMYDFELLEQALGAAGFPKVTRCSFQHGRTPDLETLDNRPQETLYVEAVREP